MLRFVRGSAMPKTCSICTHEERREIDNALLSRTAYRDITRRFGPSKDALSRHANTCIPEQLALVYKADNLAAGDNLRAELESEKQEIRDLRDKAKDSDDVRTALYACDKALKALELEAKALQLIKTQPEVNLVFSSEWMELRTVIVQALEPFDEAKAAVVQALTEAENGNH
jgi:3-dehydroquinate synthase class II